MSEGKKEGLFVPVVVAAVISLVVTLARLYGELQVLKPEDERPEWAVAEWARMLFNPDAGGGGSPFGISWLVLLFGFWFGRRLAKGGYRPRATWQAIVLPLVAFGLMIGTFIFLFVDLNAAEPGAAQQMSAEQWRTNTMILDGVAVGLGLVVLIVWPRAWLTLVAYGMLARIPVIIVQFIALEQQWGTHFEKASPGAPAELVPFLLTLAQSTVWPFFWTPVAGCIAAAFGALTVKKR